MSRNTLILTIIVVLLLGSFGFYAYYYFALRGTTGDQAEDSGFSLKEFLPFGGGKEVGSPNENKNEPQISKEKLTLEELVSGSVAGFVSFSKASSTIVRYAETETGHISDIDMTLSRVSEKVTNTTIPKVHKALFDKKAERAIFQYLEGGAVQSFSGKISKSTSTGSSLVGELKGAFLPADTKEIAVSPSREQIFQVLLFGGSIGSVSAFDGSKKSQIFDSPLSEWIPLWTNEKTILLLTKPSTNSVGFAYGLDSKSGKMEKIYGGIGLSALLSPDGKKLFVSEISSGVLKTSLYDISTKSGVDTGLKTLADKCVWNKNSSKLYCAVPRSAPGVNYPDGWYQGIISFADSVWSVEAEGLGIDELSSVSEEAREPIDIVDLALSEDEKFLFFKNKNNGSLWGLGLNN